MHPHRIGTVLAAALVVLASGTPARAVIVVIQPSNQDATLLQDFPNRPRGSGTTNTRFQVRTSTPNPRIRRGLVQFDLSAIPQNSTISSAILSLYQDSSPTAAAHTNDLHRVDEAWLQSEVKWNTQPAIQAAPTDSNATVGPVRQFYDWTVTADVQGWINAPSTNHGWLVKDAAETATNEIISYVSTEEFANPDLPKRPKLTIDFVAPPCETNADCVESPDNLCTTNERCVLGFCAVDPVICDDSDACTDNICDPDEGCLFPVGECNDGFSCTVDSCDQILGCVNTPVDANCTAEGCKEGTCVADEDDPLLDPPTGCVFTAVEPDGTTCNSDGDECTDDECLAGVCTHPDSPNGTPCSDDGNPCTDDVCNGSGDCHVNNTDPCTDDDGCTVGDECSGGSCVPGDAVLCTALSQCHEVGVCDTETGICSNPAKANGEACDDANGCTQPDECDGAGACTGPAEPQVGCRTTLVSQKAFLLMKDRTPDKKDGFTFKWVKGQATTVPDFGSPVTGSTNYQLCVYDESTDPQPLLAATAPAGGTCGTKPCWKTTKTGFKYKDNGLDPDGLQMLLLRAGPDSKAKVVVKGKGVNLGYNASPVPLQPTLPVTVQVKHSDDPALCWEATFSAPIKNLPDQFKALGD
jgi:hypothetical protein